MKNDKIVQKKRVTLIGKDDFTKQDVNTALTSVQTYCDELVRNINELKNGEENAPERTIITKGPQENLAVNIDGNAKTADHAKEADLAKKAEDSEKLGGIEADEYLTKDDLDDITNTTVENSRRLGGIKADQYLLRPDAEKIYASKEELTRPLSEDPKNQPLVVTKATNADILGGKPADAYTTDEELKTKLIDYATREELTREENPTQVAKAKYADEAGNAINLGGRPASDYLTNADIDLTPYTTREELTREVDPTVVSKAKVADLANDIADNISTSNFNVTGTLNSTGNTNLKGTSIVGDLSVTGNITQSGESYITHAEDFYTKKDIIHTRENAKDPLKDGEITGIIADSYDAQKNYGALGFDRDGVARVGDVTITKDENGKITNIDTSKTQAIATRENIPKENGIARWNKDDLKFDTVLESDMNVGNATKANGLNDGAEIGTLGTTDNAVVNKAWVKEQISTAFVYKGDKTNFADLPTVGNEVGDVYYVTSEKALYVWNGTSWDELNLNIDVSDFIKKTDEGNLNVNSAKVHRSTWIGAESNIDDFHGKDYWGKEYACQPKKPKGTWPTNIDGACNITVKSMNYDNKDNSQMTFMTIYGFKTGGVATVWKRFYSNSSAKWYDWEEDITATTLKEKQYDLHVESAKYNRRFNMNGLDLDTLKSEGHYFGWDGFTNSPRGAVIGILDVYEYSTDWVSQKFTYIRDEAEIWVRNRHNGTTWSKWYRMATHKTVDNKISAALKDLPSSTLIDGYYPLLKTSTSPSLIPNIDGWYRIAKITSPANIRSFNFILSLSTNWGYTEGSAILAIAGDGHNYSEVGATCIATNGYNDSYDFGKNFDRIRFIREVSGTTGYVDIHYNGDKSTTTLYSITSTNPNVSQVVTPEKIEDAEVNKNSGVPIDCSKVSVNGDEIVKAIQVNGGYNVNASKPGWYRLVDDIEIGGDIDFILFVKNVYYSVPSKSVSFHITKGRGGFCIAQLGSNKASIIFPKIRVATKPGGKKFAIDIYDAKEKNPPVAYIYGCTDKIFTYRVSEVVQEEEPNFLYDVYSIYDNTMAYNGSPVSISLKKSMVDDFGYTHNQKVPLKDFFSKLIEEGYTRGQEINFVWNGEKAAYLEDDDKNTIFLSGGTLHLNNLEEVKKWSHNIATYQDTNGNKYELSVKISSDTTKIKSRIRKDGKTLTQTIYTEKDLNNITESGIYTGYNMTNGPTLGAYTVFHEVYEYVENGSLTSYATQLAIDVKSNKAYFRKKNNSVWDTTWTKIATLDNITDFVSLKNGTKMDSGDDLNTYTTIGNYFSNAYGSTFTHMPEQWKKDGGAGYMIVRKVINNDTYLGQEITSYNTGNKWYRYTWNAGGEWTEWTEYATTSWKPVNLGNGANIGGNLIPTLKSGQSNVIRFNSQKLLNTGWYNILETTKESLSYIITIGRVYMSGAPQSTAFLVNNQYNICNIVQLNDAIPDNAAEINQVTSIRVGAFTDSSSKSGLRVDIYYKSYNQVAKNDTFISIIPLDNNENSYKKVDFESVPEKDSNINELKKVDIVRNSIAFNGKKISTTDDLSNYIKKDDISTLSVETAKTLYAKELIAATTEEYYKLAIKLPKYKGKLLATQGILKSNGSESIFISFARNITGEDKSCSLRKISSGFDKVDSIVKWEHVKDNVEYNLYFKVAAFGGLTFTSINGMEDCEITSSTKEAYDSFTSEQNQIKIKDLATTDEVVNITSGFKHIQTLTATSKQSDAFCIDYMTRKSSVYWSQKDVNETFSTEVSNGDYITLKIISDTGKTYIGFQQVLTIGMDADGKTIDALALMPRSYYIENALPAESTVGDKKIATLDKDGYVTYARYAKQLSATLYNNKSLNDFKSPGEYFGWSGFTDAPIVTISFMRISQYSPDWLVQEIYYPGYNRIYKRSYYNGNTWSKWVKEADVDDIPDVSSFLNATQVQTKIDDKFNLSGTTLYIN